MAGSEAEERIRVKVEAKLRQTFPDARIIHELVLKQGGVRIDLAAVTPTRLICAEIKSERDVMDRLPDQVKAMRLVCDAYIVVVADKWIDKARKVAGWLNTCRESDIDSPSDFTFAHLERHALKGMCNAPARLDMLWADELRAIGCPIPRANRTIATAYISDACTGRDVRLAVCAALRARSFPRADPAIAKPNGAPVGEPAL
jgi:hypothetical protein